METFTKLDQAVQALDHVVQAAVETAATTVHPAVEYLTALFQPNDWLCFTFLHKDSAITENRFGFMHEAISTKGIEMLTKRNQDSHIFVSMAVFKEGSENRTKPNISSVSHVFMDADENGDAVLHAVRQSVAAGEIPLPSVIVCSSPSKFQFVWNVTGFDIPLQEAMNRTLQKKFGTDAQAVDAARVLRIPGFRNIKAKYIDKPVAQIAELNPSFSPYQFSEFNIPLAVEPDRTVHEPASDKPVQASIDYLEAAMDAAGVAFVRKPWDGSDGGYKFMLDICPWNDTHENGGKSDAIAIVMPSSKYAFKCLHAHCSDKRWGDFREYLETQAGRELPFGPLSPSLVFPTPPPPPPSPASVPMAEIPADISAATTAATTESPEDVKPREPEEPLPDFTSGLTGSIADYCRAIEPDFPMEFKVMAAMTRVGLALSGKTSLEGFPNLQPRFFTALIDEPGKGKSGSDGSTALGADESKLYDVTLSCETGPALVTTFQARAAFLQLGPESTEPLKVLLSVDEIKDVFEKSKESKESKDSLGTKMLRLHDSNYCGNNTKKEGNVKIKTAHLAMIGGATPEGYHAMWKNTAGASGGLQSRVTAIGTNNPRLPRKRRPTDVAAAGTALVRILHQIENGPSLIQVSDSADAMMQLWWEGVLSRIEAGTLDSRHSVRVSDIVYRYLIVLAVTNDTAVVDGNLMQMGIAFGDHLLAARAKYNPLDSSSPVQNFENLAEAAYKKWGDMTDRELMQRVHPARYPGGYGAFKAGVQNLKDVGRVVKRDKTKGSKKQYWGLD